MTREERNSLINQINDPDRLDMIRVSDYIGDDEEVDIDWDDLLECTSTTIRNEESVEELLQTMYDLEILEILDFESGVFG